jgi:hypothetical protein
LKARIFHPARVVDGEGAAVAEAGDVATGFMRAKVNTGGGDDGADVGIGRIAAETL